MKRKTPNYQIVKKEEEKLISSSSLKPKQNP